MKKSMLLLFWSLLSAPTLGAQVCGTRYNPADLQYLENLQAKAEAYTNLQGELRQNTRIPIQVHFVAKNDGSGALPLITFNAAFEHLQKVFLPRGFDFFVCGTNLLSSDQFYDFLLNEEPQLLLTAYKKNVINLYCVDQIENGAVNGYARSPGTTDVLVIRNRDLNSMVFAHEMGHFFGLLHTHSDRDCQACTNELVNGFNCTRTGDLICDTPADPNLAGNRVIGELVDDKCAYVGALTDVNGERYKPDPRNIMSYSRINCLSQFSNGQFTRMEFFLRNARKNLRACDDLTSSNQTPAYFQSLRIWPNPVQGRQVSIAINLPKAAVLQVEVLDFLGRKTMGYKFASQREHEQVINLPQDLPSGLHIIKVKAGDSFVLRKILLDHDQ
jgi:hypothetical protein